MRWLLSLVIIFCAASAQAAEAKVKVVASFSILADMVAQVGGDAVEIVSLVGPDGDAHAYVPTPSDAKALARADLIVVNGLGFEGWFDRLVKASGSKAPVAVASRSVQSRTFIDDGIKRTDPHAWLDLVRAQDYALVIGQALGMVDPGHQGLYAERATAYAKRLADLDQWARKEIGALPPERRRAITNHDAFGYFGAAYGIEFLAPQGVTSQSEPSPRALARLIDQMKANHIRAVFMENMTSPRLAQQIAKDAGGVFGGALYPDALTRADGPAPTFEALFKHNVETLVAALK